MNEADRPLTSNDFAPSFIVAETIACVRVDPTSSLLHARPCHHFDHRLKHSPALRMHSCLNCMREYEALFPAPANAFDREVQVTEPLLDNSM